ncbi:ribose 5-phosphate isomerase B [Clostridium sp. 'deep sea']|uniref:ribose 5-phosphate isomerase B n=1 Tax=Clostridium sp. 'deep sea' TaxID=2779445 RepID=UPI0018966293|nr:ribose 5-phosphate isomerase B [Clostridium sp. 'deep sea']QOR34534.1 ribose 5-phosphate isomerase B [Clostridium sp. 'deep sea']
MIAIGSDHGGIILKKKIIQWLQSINYQVEDYGTFSDESVDYPDYAQKVSKAVAEGSTDLGILICGTGIGMAISANKVKGVRAANVSDTFSARMFKEHNNGNVICLGARVLGDELAKDIILSFLNASFAGGRHTRRVDKIMALESKN